MKKILVISPIPTHPQTAGNRTRICTLLGCLRDIGHEVHFLYVNSEPWLADRTRMEECWGRNFHFVPYNFPGRSLRRYAGRLKFLFERGFLHIQPVDYRYDSTLDGYLQNLISLVKFDAVIVEYIFWSRALECFPPGVLKIIDTLDVFTGRHLWSVDRNSPYGWYSTTAREEAKALDRADVIIAIQEKEKQFFATLSGRKIITVGHLTPHVKSPKKESSGRKILFVGSDSSMNVQGVRRFVQEVLPGIKSVLPDVQLLLAGKVCDAVADSKGCVKLGRSDDLGPVYAEADVVVNPVLFTTGISIKTMEALGYSKPVVASAAGSRGLEEGAGKAFLVCDDPAAFARAVIDVLSHPRLAHSLSESADEFVARSNAANIRELTALLS